MSGAGGRPTVYSQELANEICRRLAIDPSVRKLCRAADMPNRDTIRVWRKENPEFSGHYAIARELGFDEMAEEAIEIADENQYDMTGDEEGKPVVNWEHIRRSQIRIDTRKWYLSKCLPKIYGDRVAHEHSGPDGQPIRTAVMSEEPLPPEEFDKQFGVDDAA